MPDLDALLAEADALCEAATEGPWTLERHDVGDRYEVIVDLLVGPGHKQVMHLSGGYGHPSGANVSFIARSRTLVPELCEALRRLREERG